MTEAQQKSKVRQENTCTAGRWTRKEDETRQADETRREDEIPQTGNREKGPLNER